ncbi:hypothetical protein QBC41DRAFT_360258 [Cercophora samala]|uniref:Uncharacterized protein n=1 Tax=Cercophora samala TaxID=330535 RepID=A0AA40D429_9PEZI|nr:hypothetical protein QBC41DRAFT_360258 [Cercophora samala]
MFQTQYAPHFYGWAPNMMSPHSFFPTATNQHPCGTIGATTGLDIYNRPYGYISGLHGTGRLPQPPPVVDPAFPAANLVNSTGGVGVEPGFNYFFPREHADVVVLLSAVAPWKLTEGYERLEFVTVKVPGNVTMGELMAGFGVVGGEVGGAGGTGAGTAGIYVVYQQGNGKWEHQESVRWGGDGRVMRRTVGEMGWCSKGREGRVRTRYIWVRRG